MDSVILCRQDANKECQASRLSKTIFLLLLRESISHQAPTKIFAQHLQFLGPIFSILNLSCLHTQYKGLNPNFSLCLVPYILHSNHKTRTCQNLNVPSQPQNVPCLHIYTLPTPVLGAKQQKALEYTGQDRNRREAGLRAFLCHTVHHWASSAENLTFDH